MVGWAKYTDVTMGAAMADEHGFIKVVVVEEKSGKILGCSAVGSEAPELIQQVVYLMNVGSQDIGPLIRSQIIHPKLNEVLARAFVNLENTLSLP